MKSKEEIRARNAAYYAAHREKQRAYNAAYRAAHPEKIRAQEAAYRAAHPEEKRARNAAYRADQKRMQAWLTIRAIKEEFVKQQKRRTA